MANLEAAVDAHHESCDELFQKFKHLFSIHDKAEDDVFYPALKKLPGLVKLVNKGYQAHHLVEVAILELKLIPFYNGESFVAQSDGSVCFVFKRR